MFYVKIFTVAAELKALKAKSYIQDIITPFPINFWDLSVSGDLDYLRRAILTISCCFFFYRIIWFQNKSPSTSAV